MTTTSTPTIPRTLLEGVNELLSAIRVASVSSLLTADLNEDAAKAKQAMDTASIQFQTRGWEFNTERNAIFDPAGDGTITLPSNTLKVRSARNRVSGMRLVFRGGRLYNPHPDYRTFTIGESAACDIVLGLPFEDLTSSARLYVTGLAARSFCIPKLPDLSTFRFTEELLKTTLVAIEQEDAEMVEDDLKTTSPHFAKMGRR